MKRNRILAILSAGHGLNDFVAGYLLGNLLGLHLPLIQSSLCFIVYNGLAFGGQYFIALLLHHIQNPKRIYLASWVLNALALMCFPIFSQVSFIAAGCASAIYHVIGGSIAAQQNKASSIGWFAAPGILGLVLAGYLASQQINLWLLLTIVTVIFSSTGFIIPFKNNFRQRQTPAAIAFDKHDVLMVLLLTIITLRSALWNVFQLLYQHDYSSLLLIASSAFAGKILGGYISDRIGWRLYNFLSLVAAAPLVSFFKNELLLFCLGVALLQSGIPANTAMLLAYMKEEKEKAIALAFGTGVFMAGAVMFFPSIIQNAICQIGFFIGAIILSASILKRRDHRSIIVIDRVKRLLSPAKRLILKSR